MFTPARACVARHALQPINTCFMSCPCAEHPGYSLNALDRSLLGRSRRAEATTVRRGEVIERSRALLEMPADWRLGVVPGSDMGALEMALWSLLDPLPVGVLDFEWLRLFWAQDVVEQLKTLHSRVLHAPFGQLPDLSGVDHQEVLSAGAPAPAGLRSWGRFSGARQGEAG